MHDLPPEWVAPYPAPVVCLLASTRLSTFGVGHDAVTTGR